MPRYHCRFTPRCVLSLLACLLLLTGCSSGVVSTNQVLSSTAPTATATSAPTATPKDIPAPSSTAVPPTSTAPAPAPTATATPRPPLASPSVATGSAAPTTVAEQVLKDVVQQADDAQQRAFITQDPTPMRATATATYYAEMVQANLDLAASGATAITLVTLEWGPIVRQGTTSAQVTTFETWRTNYADGSTDQARERNVYTLVRESGTWKIQADDHPDSTAGQPGQSGTGGGAAPLPSTPLGPGQSSNWAGYAAANGDYTAISSTWTVPQVTAGSTSGADATWVGIGGERSHDLIQAGTEATVANGRVRYSAWIEMLPQVARTVPLTVRPGDRVNVAVAQQTDGTWLISFDNQTTGQQFQETELYTSSHSSAEWIEEAPSSQRGILPLDNFGTVRFEAARAVVDGQTVSIAQAKSSPLTLVDRLGHPLATPSPLGADGSSFSVTRAAVAAAPAISPSAAGMDEVEPGGIGTGLVPLIRLGSGVDALGIGGLVNALATLAHRAQ